MLERVMQSVGGIAQRRRVLEHAATLNEGEIGIKLLMEARIADAKTLSYLWMALESDMNIIILGDERSGKRPFLYSLFPLIPPYDNTFLFGCHSKNAKYYSNLIGYAARQEELGRALRSVNPTQAGRVVVADLEGLCREAFACANRGIPFLATLRGDESSIIDLLKRNRVPANTLSMLDITLTMGRGETTAWRIGNIVEHLWFGRSEYFIETAIAENNFEFKKVDIEFSDTCLAGSKMVKAYCDLNIVSNKEALAEFKKRQEFLESSAKRGLSNKEFIDSYFEIK